VTDSEIDDLLRRIGSRSPAVAPAVLERIANPLEGNLSPVKPLAPARVLAGQLLALCVAVAVTGSAWAGFDGIVLLAAWQRVILFATVASLAAIMTRECVARWSPGGLPRLSPLKVIAGSCGVLALLFALLFHHYRAGHFVTAGLGCLEQGVLHAIPAAILGVFILRRGFATRPVMAALIGGALAGLTGVMFLELHCTNTEAAHQIVWHTVVLPVSASLCGFIAWIVMRVKRARH